MQPIVDALADLDEYALDCAERRVRDAINGEGISPDITRTLEFYLGYYVYLRTVLLEYTDRQAAAYGKGLEILNGDPAGPVSSLFQRRLLLQYRIIADDMGTAPLGQADYLRLRRALRDDELGTEQWFYISKYTFKQRDLAQTARAYESFLDSGDNWARDYNWRRLEVMVKLLEGRATPLDLELLIKSMVVSGCVTEMRNVIWPVAREQGLVDDYLELLLSQRARELGSRGHQA